MIDIHSHILPGIDDGADTLEAGVELVRELVSQGVTDIIATPHFIEETIYASPKRENLKLAEDLRLALAREGIKVNIYLGNELYINERIDEMIRFNRVAAMADSSYILVELPMSGEYPGFEDTFRDLMRAGYTVILAHPERYTAVQEDFAILDRLVEMGVLLQCNTGSFVRHYGKHAEKVAIRLAKEKKIFALGSDIHHTRGGDEITLALKKLRKYYDEDGLEEILVRNPKKIIEKESSR
jgi:protein-tyrosine phosphatase